MADVYPLQAVLPPSSKASSIATQAYDVMSRVEAATMAGNNPLSFLHVTRAEIDLPDEVDEHDPQVYEKARENYEKLKRLAPLQRDGRPLYYVYAQEMGDHRQVGIAAAASIDDYDQSVIRQHEKTRREKEDDRTQHILTVGAQTGPVFLTYRPNAAIDDIVTRVTSAHPLYDFVTPDRIRHILWRVPGAFTGPLAKAFRQIPNLYIADGHHRAASASRVRAVRRESNPNHTGSESYNRFLAVVFPADQLAILPYNRVVTCDASFDLDAFISELPSEIKATPADQSAPTEPATFNMYANGAWWTLRYTGDLTRFPVVDRLDVSLLQNLILAPMLGIEDPRTDPRIAFVGGIRGTKELERRVDSGEGTVAFAMFPATVEQLMTISDAGGIMPPKSTWFEPKLRDGLLVHEL